VPANALLLAFRAACVQHGSASVSFRAALGAKTDSMNTQGVLAGLGALDTTRSAEMADGNPIKNHS
jgi:hypothetical protein